MSELKIAEVILRERRKLKLTQEELANALLVSPQAVSNWERGGYPDITLLPRIANYFKITVDELIGNDAATMAADMVDFDNKYFSRQYSKSEKLAFAKEMYEKYPNNFVLISRLEDAIVNNMESISENRELLKKLHQKIMSKCTDEEYRRYSIHCMCFVADDDELEDLIAKSELNWQEAIAIGKLREERYILQGRYDEFHRERNATDLLFFMEYIGRHEEYCMGSYYPLLFAEPERTAAWMKHVLHLLEHFDPRCTNESGVPDAWCGCYAGFTLRAAGALVASGQTDEGFSMLESAFSRYERWNRIPEGAWLDVGNPDVFDRATVNKLGKGSCVDIRFEDGKTVWAPYPWLFWQGSMNIFKAMTTWPWFEKAKSDPRFEVFLARAKEMAGLK